MDKRLKFRRRTERSQSVCESTYSGTMKRPEGVCKDCWARYTLALDINPDTEKPRWRPAPHPGPRCVTDHRAVTKERKTRAHGLKVEANFGIPAKLYWALHEFQGGKCAILNCRATGKTKALAVDHDHKCCPGRTSCGKCVRGLLCGVHNEQFGRNGDDPEVFWDMATYLKQPPFRQLIRRFAQQQTADSFALDRVHTSTAADTQQYPAPPHTHP